MKQCGKCGVKKEASAFYKNKKTKDGLHYWCKQCLLKRVKELYLLKHQEKLEYHSDYRSKNRNKIESHRKIWASTDVGKASRKESNEKYARSEKGITKHKEAQERYCAKKKEE